MLLRVLEVTHAAARSFADSWGVVGVRSVRVSYDRALELIHGAASAELLFDAVVFRLEDLGSLGDQAVGLDDGVEFVRRIRALPSNVAMFDGKKWCSIPVIILASSYRSDVTVDLAEDAQDLDQEKEVVSPYDGNHYGADVIKARIEDYRQSVLSDLDNLGFIVHYDRGRYIVGPALKSREELESRYYFGPADKRDGLLTVHRDNFGIQHEVEKFEALINRPDVNEHELQQFFEEHPHFLSQDHTPLPHVRLPKGDGTVLIPDFILKPIVAQQRDSRWEVLDLKLPQVKLLAGKGARARLSSKVADAIRQLRDYKEHFEDPKRAHEVTAVLGHALKRPKLGVLIGRLGNVDTEALEREQQYLPNVRIVTYDEILELQQALLNS